MPRKRAGLQHDGSFLIDDREANGLPMSPVCSFCVHWQQEKRGHWCAAYQQDQDKEDQIPDVIWNGKNSHRTAVVGDHGIRFELAEGFDAAVVTEMLDEIDLAATTPPETEQQRIARAVRKHIM